MKNNCRLFLAPLLFASISAAQSNAPSNQRTDVYHVLFAKAALGKAQQAADYLKTPDPKAPMPGHFVVLRHEAGDAWDYVVIEHLGTKATVDAVGNPAPPAMRDLLAWHNDTFVNGPPWAEFSRAMGIGGGSDTRASVYVVSVYRAAPGHRDPLEKTLMAPPGKGDTSSGNVIMQHLEGGAWQYFGIARYNSYQDYGVNEVNAKAQTVKGTGGWVQLRDHSDFHNDTLTDRIAP
jgi:hypothetical protein